MIQEPATSGKDNSIGGMMIEEQSMDAATDRRDDPIHRPNTEISFSLPKITVNKQSKNPIPYSVKYVGSKEQQPPQ